MDIKYRLGLIVIPFIPDAVENVNVFASDVFAFFCELSKHFPTTLPEPTETVHIHTDRVGTSRRGRRALEMWLA